MAGKTSRAPPLLTPEMLWGTGAAPASSPVGAAGLYLPNQDFAGAFLWCSQLTAPCPPFQGTGRLSAAGGIWRGAEGRRAGGSLGGTGRAAAGCLIQSHESLLVPFPNVFAPNAFKHLLRTVVWGKRRRQTGVSGSGTERGWNSPLGLGGPWMLGEGQQVAAKVSRAVGILCPQASPLSVPSCRVCQRPLYSHTQRWHSRTLFPKCPAIARTPNGLQPPQGAPRAARQGGTTSPPLKPP